MVVFFDIDGTIVDDESQIIPESTIRAVDALGKNGHLPVVNTGRPYSHIDPRVRAMAFSGYACGCGMEIWLQDHWIQRVAPGEWLCEYVIENVRACGMEVLYEAEGAIGADGVLSQAPISRLEWERLIEKGMGHWDLEGQGTRRFIKFCTWDRPGCKRAEFLGLMEPYFACIERGSSTMVEFVLKGCSKAGGMRKLLQTIGCSQENTLAIGDSANDLTMFQLAGHTACMGNGAEELKAQAEFVTAPVLDDGIEKALQHFGLI